MSSKDIAQKDDADKTRHGDRAGGPPLLGRKSVLMGMLTSGFVIANAAPAVAAGTVKPSSVAATQPPYVAKWAPATPYALGQQITSPNNDVVSTRVAHTSSAAYSSDTAKWNVSSTYVAKVGAQTLSGGIFNFTSTPTVNGVQLGVSGAISNSYGMLSGNNSVVGNGTTDDGAALNALLSAAATARVPVILSANTVIYTTVEIVIPSHTRLYGNGSTIKCGITSSIYTPTIGIRDVTDVVIDNLVVNGQKANYASNAEFQHCIGMRTSTDVLIRNCTLTYGAGDGIEIAGNNATTWSERITLEHLTCLHNNRNGLSVIACRTLRVIGGNYSYNSGTAPEAGIDVEPNNLADPIEDIAFTDVLMEHNGAFGFLINLRPGHTAKQEGIRLTSCSMRNNGQAGGGTWSSYHLTFTDCEFNDNPYGVMLGDYVKHLTIRGGVVMRNTTCGIAAFPATLDDFVVTGMRILDNVGIGLRLSSTGARFLITENIIGNDATSNTTTGIATQSSALNYVTIANNHLRGLSTALSLGDNATTRVNTGNAV